eukprot:Rhum_TRINITY_DN14547_c32_g1::Rhum_TRINITY_DN14547_c32_g1_i1::g.96533::m.96533
MSGPTPDDVTYSGYLHKLGAVNKAWKDRWFALIGNKLHYFRTKEMKNPQGTVAIEQAFAKPSGDPLQPLCFELITPQRVYQLTASSAAVMAKWVAVLNAVSDAAADNLAFDKLEESIARAEMEKARRALESEAMYSTPHGRAGHGGDGSDCDDDDDDDALGGSDASDTPGEAAAYLANASPQ